MISAAPIGNQDIRSLLRNRQGDSACRYSRPAPAPTATPRTPGASPCPACDTRAVVSGPDGPVVCRACDGTGMI